MNNTSNRQALVAYLQSVIDTPFRWGSFDCMNFANRAVQVQRGHGFVDDLMALHAHSSEQGALRLWRMAQRATGIADIVDLIDSRLPRELGPYPALGSVVARPNDCELVFSHSIGVMGSRGPIYLTPKGFQRFNRTSGDLAWTI